MENDHDAYSLLWWDYVKQYRLIEIMVALMAVITLNLLFHVEGSPWYAWTRLIVFIPGVWVAVAVLQFYRDWFREEKNKGMVGPWLDIADSALEQGQDIIVIDPKGEALAQKQKNKG